MRCEGAVCNRERRGPALPPARVLITQKDRFAAKSVFVFDLSSHLMSFCAQK